MWARQLQQISAASAATARTNRRARIANEPQRSQVQAQQNTEEIVLDGPAITSEVTSPPRQHQSRSRRGRPRLDDDDDIHVISTASARDPLTVEDSSDDDSPSTPTAQQSAAARILALHKKTMGRE